MRNPIALTRTGLRHFLVWILFLSFSLGPVLPVTAFWEALDHTVVLETDGYPVVTTACSDGAGGMLVASLVFPWRSCAVMLKVFSPEANSAEKDHTVSPAV